MNQSTNDELFMREAIKEAESALHEGNWGIGCVIVLDGKIIARSSNKVYSQKDRMAHAGMIALHQVKDVLREHQGKATLYATYEPCHIFFGAIVLNRVRVVAEVDLDKSGSMYFKENLPLLFKQDKFSVDFTNGVLADECYNVFMQGESKKGLIREGLLRKQ